jgi:hypothetical protein
MKSPSGDTRIIFRADDSSPNYTLGGVLWVQWLAERYSLAELVTR